MPMTDNDIKTDYNAAYDSAQAYWSTYISEANRDMEFMVGDQWDTAAKNYLNNRRRAALSFNKIRRVVKLIEGYQRKNRLSLKIQAVEGSDEATADQLSAIIQWQMQAMDGYEIMSDAFANGALKTGINLIQPWVDYSQDPVNGDIRLTRIPYNRFLLDPMFAARDLSDCGFICRREYYRKDAIRSILPESARDAIKDIKPKGAMDTKYLGTATHAVNMWGGKEPPMRYDEYWRRVYKDVTVLFDKMTGEMVPWEGDKDRLMFALQVSNGRLEKLNMVKKSVEMTILVEDIPVYTGPEPCGMDDYPFVPVMGFFEPEVERSELKMQGIIRCMRDPQIEVNKRRSKMLDMIDSQISTGWKAEEGAVINEEVLYRGGQGQVVFTKTGKKDMVDRLMPPDIPPGLMQLSELLDKDIMEIPGANSELMGMPESNNVEVAGMLAKMRQGQGITILQDLFDNYRLSKKILGRKLVQIVQKKYTPAKVMRITGKPPAQEFFTQNFGKYDCMAVEGVLTDSQRQMSFGQLLGMKQMGAPIPWSAIIDVAPLENKDELKKAVEAEEQGQAQAQQKQMQMEQMNMAMAQAKLSEMAAEQRRESTQATENAADAELKRVKTMAEVNAMGFDRYAKLLEVLAKIEQAQAQHTAAVQSEGVTGAYDGS
ncbi:MAG: hypothetical protein JEY79_17320 [Pseudodesulfovibrio sp.]|nr:hypothetical protein [Pseudodesulfovibrio sp.]